MAVEKRNGRYQVKVRGTDGKWVTRTFETKARADEQERVWLQSKHAGSILTQTLETISVAKFFALWIQRKESENSQSGWSKIQKHYFRDYINPLIGECRVRAVNPLMIQEIFLNMRNGGLAPKTQLLVYQTMRALFSSAVRQGIRPQSPVLEEDKPKVPVREAVHLNVEQASALLSFVSDKPYGVAIWLQLYLGLRTSEVQALSWEDFDFESGKVTIRRAFVNRTLVTRDYPKGGRQHVQAIPFELAEFLLRQPRHPWDSRNVVASTDGKPFSYRWYNKTLHRYCRELGIPQVGTHGLRHTTAEIYLSHGANKEDLQKLFAHSGMGITERYIHNWKSNLESVAGNIRLLSGCSQNVPK